MANVKLAMEYAAKIEREAIEKGTSKIGAAFDKAYEKHNYDIDELFRGAVRLNTEEMEKRRVWEAANKGFELRMLDIVRIKSGTVGVVAGLNGSKDASLAFSGDSTGHKVAWWHPSELQVIGNVQDWVGILEK